MTWRKGEGRYKNNLCTSIAFFVVVWGGGKEKRKGERGGGKRGKGTIQWKMMTIIGFFGERGPRGKGRAEVGSGVRGSVYDVIDQGEGGGGGKGKKGGGGSLVEAFE